MKCPLVRRLLVRSLLSGLTERHVLLYKSNLSIFYLVRQVWAYAVSILVLSCQHIVGSLISIEL